ncbi:MAG TPA: hypothetical protein ENN40_08625 [Candidatus Aminicenantes bacterium]|nr:hypothetical protein [Candidatus Aminicenantes bacterium]
MKKFRVLAWLITGVFAGSLLFWVTGYGMAQAKGSSAERLRSEYQLLQQRRNQLKKKRETLDAWKRVPAELDAFRTKAIPAFNRFPAFRDDLQRRISESGLTPLRLTYRMRPVQQNLQRVTLEFSLSGPYAAIKRLIHGVENQAEMVYLMSVRLRRTESGVIANFLMEAYFAR